MANRSEDIAGLKLLVEGISDTVNKSLHNANFDRTSVGIIKSKISGGYLVSAFGGEYEIITNEDYKVNTTVAVVAPQNNFKKLYIKPYQVDQSVVKIKKVNEDLANYKNEVTGNISDLQTQLDGKTDQYFYNYSPTLTNIPANNWSNEATKADHNGDIFYNTSNGDVYQWKSTDGVWGWAKSGDSGLASAMAAAAEAQATADGKRRVFIKTPTPPYEIGDLWFDGTDILTCLTNRKATDTYDVTADFGKKNGYVDESKSVADVDVYYVLSTSSSEAPTTGWQTIAPTWTDGYYMWQKTVATYADKHTVTSDPTCISGATGQGGSKGVGIYKVTENYYKSTSATSLTGGTWVTTAPTWEDQKYIWTKSVITYTDNTTSETNPVCATGSQGTKGDQGDKGEDAKGLNLYASKYAIAYNADNTPKDTTDIILTAVQQNFTTEISWVTDPDTLVISAISGKPNQRSIAYNAFDSLSQATVSISSGGFTDSVTLVKISDGEAGSNGADAYSVILDNEACSFAGDVDSAVAATTQCGVIAYKGTKQIPATIGTITDIPVGMTTSISNNNSTSASITISVTDTMNTRHGSLTVPITVDSHLFLKKFVYSLALKGDAGETGDTGNGISSVTEYYLATSLSSDITINTQGWSTTIATMSVTNKYLWNYEVIHYTTGSQTTTPKIIGVYGNTGNVGSTGNGIVSVTNYYLVTSLKTGITFATNGWTETIQQVDSTNKYLWNYEVISYTDNTTSSTTPCIIGAYGDKGEDAITMSITSSNGTVLKDSVGSTVLTAHVYKAGIEQSITDAGVCGTLGSVKWYISGSTTATATAKTLTVSAVDVINSVVYICQLEA